MQAKEQLINEVKCDMESILTEKEMEFLIYSLSKNLHHKNVTIDENLPSVDLADNKHIIETFIVSKKIEGATPRTLEAYYYTIKRFADLIDVEILKVDTNIIRLYLLQVGKTSSGVTVDNVRRYLNTFFRWLYEEGYMDCNPCEKIKRIKTEKKIKTALTPLEVEKIRDCCETDKEIALIDLLCSTGIRCEEITKIKLTDCDFLNKKIKIHGKGNKERIVYMSEKCKLHLERYLESRRRESEYLFAPDRRDCNARFTTSGIAEIMRKLGKRSGVDRCQVHRFRKYFATTLLNRGCDVVYVKMLLGHEQLNTTMIYTQISDKKVRTQFEQYIDA